MKIAILNFTSENNVHFIEERYIPYWGSSNTIHRTIPIHQVV